MIDIYCFYLTSFTVIAKERIQRLVKRFLFIFKQYKEEHVYHTHTHTNAGLLLWLSELRGNIALIYYFLHQKPYINISDNITSLKS